MYLQKVRSKKTLTNFFLVAILKVTDENSRILIRTKMSRIRNNAFKGTVL
jgi:hypothetical protein